MKTAKGSVPKWLDTVALRHAGDECLPFPFYRAASGHGRLSGRKGPALAHIYVAERALGKKPSPKHECCHSCGNGHLGCVNPRHLYWGTRAQNVADRKTHGVFVPPPVRRGVNNNKVKLSIADVKAIRERLAGGEPMLHIGRSYGVTTTTIMNIKVGKTWSWLK